MARASQGPGDSELLKEEVKKQVPDKITLFLHSCGVGLLLCQQSWWELGPLFGGRGREQECWVLL